jgi:hypothetical protein
MVAIRLHQQENLTSALKNIMCFVCGGCPCGPKSLRQFIHLYRKPLYELVLDDHVDNGRMNFNREMLNG